MNIGMVVGLVIGGLGLLVLGYVFLINEWNELTSGASGFYMVFLTFPLLGVGTILFVSSMIVFVLSWLAHVLS